MLRVCKEYTRRNLFRQLDHTLEVVFIRDISGDVITEHALHERDGFDLCKIGVAIAVQNVEIVFVTLSNVGAIRG